MAYLKGTGTTSRYVGADDERRARDVLAAHHADAGQLPGPQTEFDVDVDTATMAEAAGAMDLSQLLVDLSDAEPEGDAHEDRVGAVRSPAGRPAGVASAGVGAGESPLLGLRVTGLEWGGACDRCRITWAWPREPKQTRAQDLLAGRCPRCGAGGLRAAHGQAAYETLRVERGGVRVDQCQADEACGLPNYHRRRSGWPCRGAAGRL